MQQQRKAGHTSSTRSPHAPINPEQATPRRGNWRSKKAEADLYRMGEALGAMAAKFWPVNSTTKRYRSSTIAAYRDSSMSDCVGHLKHPHYAGAFKEGYMMGFEDEAMNRAEAGHKEFDGVAAGGSVDDEVRGNGLLVMASLAEEQFGKASAAADKACDTSVMIQEIAQHMIAAARMTALDACIKSGEKYAALKAARAAAGLKDD